MKTIPEFTFKGEQFSEENSKNFLQLLLNAKKEISLKESEIKSERSAQIFLERIEVYRLKFVVSDFFFIMCMMTFVKSPGHIMILLRLCYQYWEKTDKDFIGINEFAEIFSYGTPTDKELETMWDSQKYFEREPGGSDNLLDYYISWGGDTSAFNDGSPESIRKAYYNG